MMGKPIWMVLVGLAGLPAASPLARAQAQDEAGQGLEMGVTRFYRGASRQTVVDAFCRIPFTALSPLSGGGAGVAEGSAAYRVTVSVRDSAGLELVAQSWSRTVPAGALNAARGSTLEHFTFAASPGTYAVEVTVRDSATGRLTRHQLSVPAFGGAPAASDLLLATGLRAAAGADTALRVGELRKGGVIVEAALRPRLTPRQAEVGYYLEWYAAAAETAAVSIRIVKGADSVVVATASQPVAFAAGGGATRGMVDVAGLPPGDYGFEVVVQGRDTVIARRASFRMAGMEAALEAPAPADRFGAMTEAQLDTLYAPLVYLMAADESGMYGSLTVDGKRNFLRRFWSRRDPTPGTQQNEAQEDYYRRIGEANRRYREGGAAQIPGWRTDRGRIFIKYGPPQEVLQRPQAGSTLPYEVWKYTRGRALKYVFLDQTQFGNYALIWTDDRREPSRPNWEALLGPDAVQEVQRF